MAAVDASARLEQQPAFVLHTRPWREASQLVEVLSARDGRLGLVARGLSSPRAQSLRAALQPWQWIGVTWLPRGELGQLRAAEALDTAPRFPGAAVLPGFYVNELILRLVPRQDPLPGLYRAYAEVRQMLGEGEQLAWALRRFERDLLTELGFWQDLGVDADGRAVDPGASYRLVPGQGLHRCSGTAAGAVVSGQALLDLQADRCPPSPMLGSLRLPMRGVLAHHLGPRGLQSWEMAASLGR